jgi:hypothetical protein
LPFSLAAGAGFVATVVLYEGLAPGWAGDHIGMSAPTLAPYALAAFIWVGCANVVFEFVWRAEDLAKPKDPAAYRRRAYPALVLVAAAAWPVFVGGAVLVAWLRSR